MTTLNIESATLVEALYQTRKHAPDEGFPTYQAEADAIIEWLAKADENCDCDACLIAEAKSDLGPGHDIRAQDIEGRGSWVVCATHQMTLMAGAGGVEHDLVIADMKARTTKGDAS